MILDGEFSELLKKYPNLRRAKRGGKNSKDNLWNIENIRDGFSYFFDIYGHYPTSQEVDSFDFLISSRQIQRSFGGVVKIRKQLNLKAPKDYTKGRIRSDIAGIADKRAKEYEEEFYSFLISRLDEVRVHEHKIIRPGNICSDFFIYTSGKSGVVIDLFYAADFHSFKGVINIKTKRYLPVKFPVYFVLVKDSLIDQRQIEQIILNKKILMPSHISVITELSFKEKFDEIISKKY